MKKITIEEYNKKLQEKYPKDVLSCLKYSLMTEPCIIQHFGGQEAFVKRQKYDNIKKQWCQRNNIKLIIIRYDENILKRLQIEGVIK